MSGVERFFSARTFFLLSGLFIVYATTIPWDLAPPLRLDRVAWFPFWDADRGRVWSVPDIVQNVVLFSPFGFFGALARKQPRRPVLEALTLGLFGLGLSIVVEALQTMSMLRRPAATDLASNFLGALFGALLAANYRQRMEARLGAWLRHTARTRPGALILLAYALALSLGALAPFIPTLDIGLLRESLRNFLEAPMGRKPLGALVTDGLYFGALGFLATHELPALLGRNGLRGVRAAGLALAGCVTLELALESAQLFIVGHGPGLQDELTAGVGAAAGALLAVSSPGGAPRPALHLGELTRRAPLLVFGFGIAAPVTRALSPFSFRALEEGLAATSFENLLPFASLFEHLDLSTVRNVFEAVMIYLPLGYACSARGWAPRVGIAFCLALAWILEVLQLFVVGRVPDITEGLYAGLMGYAGAWVLTTLGPARPDR